MAESLSLPPQFSGWRVKVRDKEIGHPPHVHIGRRTAEWRFGLRERAFLDSQPDPREVPRELVEYLLAHRSELIAMWDRLYPNNPVGGTDDD
jgi:hypothetical protein